MNNKSGFGIEKQWCGEEGWSEWFPAFSFGTDLQGTNDLFDVLSTYFNNAVSPEGLETVPHRWRIYDIDSNEVVEVSGDINMVQLSELGSYDTCGVGEVPSWVEGDGRNIEVNASILEELLEKGYLEIQDEEDEDEY